MNYILYNLKKVFLYIFISFIFILSTYSQTTQVQFGKNRVQYKKIKWQTIETPYYDLYFYEEGKEVSNFVQSIVEPEIERLIEELSYSYRKNIDIMVFNNLTDFAQNNIGLNNESFNTGGTKKIYDNKVFVYFDGNHQHLQQDLTFSIAEVLLNQMMKGDGFGQRFLSLLLLRLPPWYKTGVANYVAYDWNTNDDDELRQIFLSNRNTSFNKLSNQRLVLAGKSFWNMIAEEYGNSAIGNVLYLTRINHSINTGFKIATGKKLETLVKDWHQFYSKRYEADAQNRDDFEASDIILKSKKNIVSQYITNNVGDKQAYVLNNTKNAYKVLLAQNNHVKKIAINRIKSDPSTPDNINNYPIIAWSKDGNSLAVIENKPKKTIITIHDLVSKKKTKKTIVGVESVHGADFTFNNQALVLSAQNSGQTDLFLYNFTSNSVQPITQSIFDDLHPNVLKLNGKEYILYSSNDALNEIGDIQNYQFENLDLFLTNLNGTQTTRLTETADCNEIAIGSYSADSYTFLSDENGIFNQYTGYLSNLFTHNDTIIINNDTIINEQYKQKGIYNPITNFKYNIKHLAVSNQDNYYVFEDQHKRKKIYRIQKTNKTASKPSISLQATSRITSITASDIPNIEPKNEVKETKTNTISESIDSLYIGNFPYTFQTKYKNNITSKKEDDPIVVNFTDDKNDKYTINNNQTNTSKKFINYTNLKKKDSQFYKSKFSSDFYTFKIIDNTLMQTYQSVAQNLSTYRFPKIGMLFNVGISDVMDNHKLVASVRIPFSLDRTEVSIRYDNLKNRVDYFASIYRRSNRFDFAPDDSLGNDITTYYIAKTITYVAEAGISIPIDYSKSIKISGNYRNEKFVPLYTDIETLTFSNSKENWLSAKAEFVYDNTTEIQLNIPKGLKFKVFAEYFNNINQNKSNIYNVGFDLRYYQKIHKNFIWANRIAFASSFGSQKILYFLGGVDAWLNQQYNTSISVDGNTSYGLQAPVNNMRGLQQNIRNGNNYLLWNTEFRLPLFSYLAKRPIQSDFIRDFQIIGFLDAGMTYSKANPFDKENAYIYQYVNNPNKDIPLVVNAKYYRNPFVFGFGAGLRTSILGYFFRIDAGFGHDGNKLSNKPIWHLSFSKDF